MNPMLLRGKKIVGLEGDILGEMNDLHADFKTWKATAFTVILTNEAAAELNIRKPLLRRIIIGLPIELIKVVGDVITLTAPLRNLRDIAEREIEVNTDKIEGKRVESANGTIVGNVEALDVNLNSWSVTGLQVGLTDEAATELGFKRPILSKVVVVIPVEAVGEVENFVTLDKSIGDLKSLVECIKSCELQK